jgi:hypothetical protein
MSRLALSACFLLALFAGGCGNGKVRVRLTNHTASAITDCVFTYDNGKRKAFGTVNAGESRSFLFTPSGDSTLLLSYQANGVTRRFNEGYFCRGSYDAPEFHVYDDRLEYGVDPHWNTIPYDSPASSAATGEKTEAEPKSCPMDRVRFMNYSPH